MAKETFVAAQNRIFAGLREHGWQVKGGLKVPHATNPYGDVRLWFKPQAVWMSQGVSHDLGNARSIFVDIRGTDIDSLLAYVKKWAS